MQRKIEIYKAPRPNSEMLTTDTLPVSGSPIQDAQTKARYAKNNLYSHHSGLETVKWNAIL